MGAISELTGTECSGRTSLALSFVAGLTGSGRVCAWIDVSDALDPESAAAIGVDLDRLLWIRCGKPPQQLALPGFGVNPSAKEKENYSSAGRVPHICPVSAVVGAHESRLNSDFPVRLTSLREEPAVRNIPAAKRPPAVREDFAPRCAEPQPTIRRKSREGISLQPVTCNLSPAPNPDSAPRPHRPRKPYSRLDQALRVADLLLQAGGFSVIVLDMASVAPEFALRVPLATWFRYRAAAERTQASVLLLTQQACTKSRAGVVLHCQPGPVLSEGGAVFTGAEYRVEIARERFVPVTEFSRKPPQSNYRSERSVHWQSRAAWGGRS
jgi:recombination protein RecA